MKEKEAIVVNIFGGPGTGKSILAAELFARLKKEFISCDISHEYIKTKLREKALKATESQIYIFGKQQFQLFCLKDEVDVIITDSPILFCTIYDKTECPYLRDLILKEYDKYNNLNTYLNRDLTVLYEQEGRYQDLNGAKLVDTKIYDFLIKQQIPIKEYYNILEDTITDIIKNIKEKL